MSIEGNSFKTKKSESLNDSFTLDRRGFLKLSALAITQTKKEHTESFNDIPDENGILEVFDKLRNNIQFTERRHAEDEHGVYLWEIECQIEEGTVEFGYMRKGRYPVGGSALATKMYVTLFDENGVPTGGHDMAEYKNGEWEITHRPDV